MYPKHMKRHGHGHGHGHGHKHGPHGHKRGGRNEAFGPHFKEFGRHMGKDCFGRKHHGGKDFDRGCFSESEIPDKTIQNMEAGAQAAPKQTVRREFYWRRHHWRHGVCCCEKKVTPAITEENAATGDKADAPETSAETMETGEKDNAPGTSTENTGEKDKIVHCCRRGWKHHKGKRGYGCKKCHGEESTTDKEATTEDEGGPKDGYIRKHYRGHHGGRRGPRFWGVGPEGNEHHGGRRGPRFWGVGPEGNEHMVRMFKERHHHGGKWGHGPHGHHNRHWGRHGYCIIMVDAAVNTEDPAPQENLIEDVTTQEEPNTNQNMEQEATQEVSQEQPAPENDERVLEVTDNLRRSSLE